MSHAEGFRSPTVGAAGLGSSGGRIVFIDDASAITHNPANLVQLDRWEASVEATFVYHAVEFESSGTSARTREPWNFLPNFFAGGPVIPDRLALGLGVTVPYGLSVDWGDGSAFGYQSPYFVDLKSFNFNPTASVVIVPNLTLGVGLDVMWSEISLQQTVPFGVGLPLGEVDAQGDGLGWTGNLGVTWNFLPRHWLAATVRGPMDLDYQGDLSVFNLPGAGGAPVVSPMSTEIAFPISVAGGYGFEISDRIRIEANFEWLEFSRFDTLALHIPQSPLGPDIITRQDWRNTITLGAGGSFDVGHGWRLRLSYQHFQTPVPEETFTPAIPDADQHVVTFGVRYRCGRHRLEAAYAPVFYEDREISGNQVPAYDGRYTFNVHLISAAYGFSF